MKMQLNKCGLDLKDDVAFLKLTPRSPYQIYDVGVYAGIYYCDHCGIESWGFWQWLSDWAEKPGHVPILKGKFTEIANEITAFTNMSSCPFCGAPLSKDMGHYMADAYALPDGFEKPYGFLKVNDYNCNMADDNDMIDGTYWETFRSACRGIGSLRCGVTFNTRDYFEQTEAERNRLRLCAIESLSSCCNEFRTNQDEQDANKLLTKFIENCNSNTSEETPLSVISTNISQSPEDLKGYIKALIDTEANIYSLSKRLEDLYLQRIVNTRDLYSQIGLSLFKEQQVIEKNLNIARENYHNRRKELKEANIGAPTTKRPPRPQKPVRINIECCTHRADFPKMPVEPTPNVPGFFNKKKVLAENEAMMEQYKLALCDYEKAIAAYKLRLDSKYERELAEYEQAILKYEHELNSIIEQDEKSKKILVKQAQEYFEQAKSRLESAKSKEDAFNNKRDKLFALDTEFPCPEYALKTFIDNEIETAENALKCALDVRRKLYNVDVIFGKYRDIVALSTFYEYLSSGRCTKLEGADGAYNLYEAECRANMIISQLSKVIQLLEKIKENQYMLYDVLQSIEAKLSTLNSTSFRMADTLKNISNNTSTTNSYLDHISQNSAVIAYNTAVTAHYAKVNAELTNALGYMIALS